MALRDYQAELLENTREAFRRRARRVLMQAPTGAGKTIISTEMIGGSAGRGLRSLFIVHRRELIEQTSQAFAAAGIEHGVIGAGFPTALDRPVQIAGVQSLPGVWDRLAAPDFILVDEAHHAVAIQWSRVFERWPEARIVGLTATPERLDGKGLDSHFDVLVEGPSVARLITDGWLSPFRYYAPGRPDLAGCRTTAGDYNRADIGSLMDKPKLIGDVVDHYQRLATGQRGIVFAVSREHGEHLAEAFRAVGVRCEHVDSSIPAKLRGARVEAFRRGAIDVLTNVDLFGEGFDVPGIVYVGLARPTKSLSLHVQQVGRALRVAPGKDAAIICDHAGNAFVHGLPDDERSWSLKGRMKRSRTASGPSDAAPVHQCLTCYVVSPSRLGVCLGCGEAFGGQGRDVEQAAGELFPLDRAAAQALAEVERQSAVAARKAEERACKSIAELTALGIARGYASPVGWARGVFSRRSSWQRRRAA